MTSVTMQTGHPRKHRVILDTDIGTDVDDALALAVLLGSPEVDLLGVTTAYGDTMLRARIARRYARLAGGGDVRVFAGAPKTLSGREIWWAGVEGTLHASLDHESFETTDAVDFLVDMVVTNPGEIDVIAIAPLTNIALAVQAHEGFASAVRHLWVMGGDFPPAETEHNFRSDDEAARVVLGAGIPTTITGLNATRQVRIRQDQLERIGSAGALGAALSADIRQWWDFWNEQWNVPHDPVAVLTLLRPELFEFSSPGNVDVELGGERAGWSSFPGGDGNTRVVTGLDTETVTAEIVTRIEAAGDSDASTAGEDNS